MSRGALAVACLAAAFLLTGCGERGEPLGVDVSPYPVTVSGSDDKAVTVPASPERIVTLSAGTAAILKDLGAGSELLSSRAVWNAGDRKLPSLVAKLRPDLVIATSATPKQVRDRVAAEAKAPVYLMEDGTLHDIETALIDLGLLTNRSIRARALVHADETVRSRLAREHAGRRPVRVFVDTGFLSTTVSTRELFSDLLRIAGGKNVAGPDPAPGLFSLALLAKLDPEVYFLTTKSAAPAYLESRPKARKISAVRDHRFHAIPPEVLEPRAQLGPRLVRLAELLRPDARS